MRKLDTFEGRSAIYTWIHQIATNIALGRLRQQRREPDVDINTEDFENLVSGRAHQSMATWQDEGDNTFVKEALDQAVENLPEKLRIVFLLRDVEGFSTRETAELLDITPANVKVRLMRARIQLRNELAHLRPSQGTRA